MNKLKKFSFAIFLSVFCFNSDAQSNVPSAVNFQSIARDGSGNLVTNTNIEVQFTILDGGPLGTALRQPRFIRNTDQYGQFSLTLSEDSATSFGPSGATLIPNIDWASGNKWIKIEFRPNLISPYTLIETIRCNSTFYAFAAKSAEKINIAGVNGQVLKHNGTDWVAGVDNGQNYIAGGGINISGGNIVSLKSFNDFAIFEERRPGGTDIASVAGYNTRNLNHTHFLNGSAISRTGNIITLQAGTYFINAKAACLIANSHRLCLRDLTNNIVLLGTSEYNNVIQTSSNHSFVDGVIVVPATTSYRLDHYLTVGNPVNGQGSGGNVPPGQAEIHSRIIIQKLD